jgi:hypothetical protein
VFGIHDRKRTWLAAFALYFDRLQRRELSADYGLREGRLWPVVLASIALGPELARRRSRA